jgi:heme/copper-type cytochrome/quinol oxidase subunit 3
MSPAEVATIERLPVAPRGQLASGWWGMVMLIITEAALFSALLFCYYYVFAQHADHQWPPNGQLALKGALPNTIVLFLSGVAFAWAHSAMRRGELRKVPVRLALSIVLGIVFIVVQAFEWHSKPFNWRSHTFGSLYYTITGFHMLHVAVGVLMLVAVLVWAARGRYTRTDHLGMTTTGYYWHFVDAVWLVVFFSFYLWPRLT